MELKSKELRTLLGTGKFEEAEAFIKANIKGELIIATLHRLTEEGLGIMSYSFASYMIAKHETSFWHKVAATILHESIGGLKMGDQAALRHVLRAIELAPDNWPLKEYALAFYAKGALDLAHAKVLAAEVAHHDASNSQAQKILATM